MELTYSESARVQHAVFLQHRDNPLDGPASAAAAYGAIVRQMLAADCPAHLVRLYARTASRFAVMAYEPNECSPEYDGPPAWQDPWAAGIARSH